METSREAYSISSPSQRFIPSFVSTTMTHVPLLSARVSTIQKYNVGNIIGYKTFDLGNRSTNEYVKTLRRLDAVSLATLVISYQRKRRNGNAQTTINPKYMPVPPL